MKILLLGGTGAMGLPLANILLSQGNEVFITSRSNTSSFQQGAKFLNGDAHNISFLKQILQNKWDAIVDFMVYSTHEFLDRYMLLLNSTEHYLFMSSSRVYANSEKPITESSPRLYDVSTDYDYLSTDEYALLKAREENLLANSGKKNYTIIRPYITYAQNRLQLGVLEKEQWLYRLLQGRTVVFSKDISCHYTTMTYAGDVAACIAKLIHNPNAFGEAFHITTPQSIKWEDVMNTYLITYSAVTGKDIKVKLLDKDINLSSETKQYQVKYDRYFDRRFDNTKLLNVIGKHDFIDVKQGLTDSLSNFLTAPKFLYFPLSDEKVRNRLTGEYFNFSEVVGTEQKFRLLVKRMLHL